VFEVIDVALIFENVDVPDDEILPKIEPETDNGVKI
jgi:hypothetical protein